jgi:hypothetical protein
MANETLEGKLIGNTFPGLIKTGGNTEISGPVILTDGCGNSSSLSLGTANQGIVVTGNITGNSVAASNNVTATNSVVGGNISTTGYLHAATTAGSCVGIGTISPGQKLTVNGSVSANGDLYLTDSKIYASNGCGASGNILATDGNKVCWTPGGTGGTCVGNICKCSNTSTCNYVSKFTPNGTTIGNSIIRDNGNIGISEAPNSSFKLKVCGITCSEKFVSTVDGFHGNLTGNISSNTCVNGNLTVNNASTLVGGVDINSTLDVDQLATFQSAKMVGSFLDKNGAPGTSGAVLKSTGGGVEWDTLPAAGPGADATGTVKGSGTTNYITKFTNGCGIIGNSVIRESSSRIGVGGAPDSSCTFKVTGGANVTGGISTGSVNSSGNIVSTGGIVQASGCVAGSSIYTGGSQRISSGGAFTGNSLNVSTTIIAGGDITAFSTSDERLKDNLTCVTDSNNIINGLNNYCFDWNGKSEKEGSGIGVLAQDVQKVLPNAVCERDNGYLAVDYNQFIPVLLQRVKELSAEVEDLKAKIS